MDVIKQLSNVKLISTIKQEDDEAAWLKARTNGIGGSDVGAICGVSPFSSARRVYLSKIGMYDSELLAPDNASKERMRFGHVLEPVVADEYARRTGARLKTIDATMCHKDHPWRLANIDRLIVDENDKPIGILECKTTSEYCKEEWETGDILLSYIYQLNWYLHILDLKVGAFACLVGGNKFYMIDVIRNDELLEDEIIPTCESFWFNNVLKCVEPPLQSNDDELVNSMYPEVKKGSEVFLNNDDVADDLVATIVSCKDQIKDLKKIEEEAKNRVKELLKESEIGYTNNYTVKWSVKKQRRVDTAMLKLEFPEAYEACAKEVSYREMRIKGA